MPIIDEVVIELDVKTDKVKSGLRKPENDIKSFVGKMSKIIAAAYSSKVIYDFSKQLISSTDELGKFANSIGDDISKISTFEQAVQRSGGSVQGFRSSIEQLSTKIVESRRVGGESARLFNILGVSINNSSGQARKATNVLSSLNVAFQRLSSEQQLAYGKKLGLDRGTVMLLQNTPEMFQKLIEKQRALGVVTKEQAQLSAELNDLQADLKQSFNALSMELLQVVSPAIKWINEKLIELVQWARKNKTQVITILSGIGIAIATSITAPLIKAGIAALVAFAPYYGIAAAIGAIASAVFLIVEDIMRAFQGGESYFGDFTRWTTQIGSNITQGVKSILDSIINMIKSVMNFISATITDKIDLLKEKISPIFDIFNKTKQFLSGNGTLSSNINLVGAGSISGAGGVITENNNRLQMGDININVANGDPQTIKDTVLGTLNQGWSPLLNINSGRRS